MFHVSIDDKFFFISRDQLVFTELLKKLIPIFIKFRYTSKYNEQNHSIDLAYALKNGDFHGLAQINEFSNNKIDTKFKSVYPVVRYYTRFGFLAVAYNDIFIALNLYIKTLSIYDGNGGQTINLSENWDQTCKTLMTALPDIDNLIKAHVVKENITITPKKLVEETIVIEAGPTEHIQIKKPAETKDPKVAAANFIEKEIVDKKIAKIVPNEEEELDLDDGLPSMEDAMADAIKDSGNVDG